MKYLSGKYNVIKFKPILMKNLFRDVSGMNAFYQLISVIDYKGRVTSIGDSQGHYTCDVQDVKTKFWFRTNDNCTPLQIQNTEVSKNGYVMLYKRI